MVLSILLQAVTGGIGFTAIAQVLGVAVTVFSACWGISRIAQTALESIARQPEAGNDIRMSMIIAAALVEGVSLFAIVACGFVIGNS